MEKTPEASTEERLKDTIEGGSGGAGGGGGCRPHTSKVAPTAEAEASEITTFSMHRAVPAPGALVDTAVTSTRVVGED
eukprot:scaffold665_cov341-Prasinococcus_capsulatus_cf.AAC.14